MFRAIALKKLRETWTFAALGVALFAGLVCNQVGKWSPLLSYLLGWIPGLKPCACPSVFPFLHDSFQTPYTFVAAGLAIVLTGIGLFAVVSYLVRERTKELGLRMAIGASPGSVMKLVVSQSLKLALFGTGVGLALTFIIAHLMTSMVYGIHPNDPAVFLAVALSVAAVSVLAAYIPARRASRIEPMAALREQ